jgi:DNA polymerase-3 subunit delta'
VAQAKIVAGGDTGDAGADDGDVEVLGCTQGQTPGLWRGPRMLCWMRAHGHGDMADDSDEYDDGTAEPAAPAEVPEPRANPYLVGHEAAAAALIEAHGQGKLPHAIIIGGPRGIGKATLAFRLARFLFSQGSGGVGLFSTAPPSSLALAADDPVFSRVASGGHADLLTIERGINPSKWKKRDTPPDADSRKRVLRDEIVVDDTREVANFLRLTAAEGGWRVVIIDSADDMNRNAANALLKILEEPPQHALLILVSHNPGRLLPTIRSRCRKLALKPLAQTEVVRLIGRYRPDISYDDGQALARLGEGSIGRALDLAGAGGIDLYRTLLKLLGRLPELDAVALHSFADKLARAEAEDAYRTVAELLTQWLGRMIRMAAQGSETGAEAGGEGEIVRGELDGMRRLAARRPLDQWVEVWEKTVRLFAQADGLNLDRKQVVLGAFLALEGAAR